MSTSRFFVTSLPLDTTEEELRTLFKDYGPVKFVDLKSKENALDPSKVNVFAFVTLEISAEDAEYYVNELKWKKLRGVSIRVSIAKESFLERLKRERAENASVKSETILENEEVPNRTEVYPESSQNTRRVFAEDKDIDDEISADLITKKRAARSIQNGKIIIEESGAAPLHVIEKPKKTKQDPGAKKNSTAEQKRKESLNKMKTQYEQKKNAIKDALSDLNKKSNKIVFSDAEEENETTKSKMKTNIFGLDNENEEDITDLRLDYGKKGNKLAMLKSQNQCADARFKIDEKFVEEADEGGTNETKNDGDKDDEDSETDERKWQLNILEQVVGHAIDKSTAAEKAAKNKKMVRFDPSKSEHKKLLVRKNSENEPENNAKAADAEEQQNTAPVSQDVFYVVSDSFTQALKTRGEGFSLLNMFGTQAASAELEKREDHLKKLKDERILVNKLNKNAQTTIHYESSSSGEDDEETVGKKDSANETTKTRKQKGQKQKVPVFMETFFFTKNDERFKEGALFFQYDKQYQIPEENYEPVRRKLNALIKKKITKTKRNQFGGQRKGKRNKKKL